MMPLEPACSQRWLTPERHADARDGVERGEAPDGILPAGLPERNLSVAHARETSGGDAVVLAQPDRTAVLGAFVTGVLVHSLFLADIPDAQLLVSRGRDHHGAVTAPRQTLHDVGVLQRDAGLAGADVPELDGEVARGRGKNVFGGGVEQDLPDLSATE